MDAEYHNCHRHPADNVAAYNRKRRDQTDDRISHRMSLNIRTQIDQSAADEQRYDTDFCYVEISFLKYKKVEMRELFRNSTFTLLFNQFLYTIHHTIVYNPPQSTVLYYP